MDDPSIVCRPDLVAPDAPPPDWAELAPVERLRFKRAVLEWCLRQAGRAHRRHGFENALRWDLLAARTASFDCDPLVSPELEAQLLALASRVPVPAAPSRPAAPPPERWLHVFSQGHAYGGHTAMMRRWARLDRANQHSVLLLEQEGPAPESLIRVVEESGGRVVTIDRHAPLLEQATTLRGHAWTHADFVVLHVHPWDVVATVALGVPGGPPVLLVNHGAHKFWVGASVADAVVNCRISHQEDEWNRDHRGVDRNLVLPIPIEAPPRPSDGRPRPPAGTGLREALGIPPPDLVLLTIGQGYKYTPLPGLDFLEAIVPILHAHPRAHLVGVGPKEDPRWQAAREATAGRVHAMGVHTDLRPYHAAADLYLEGFPFGSMTAILEAGSQGIACVQPPRTSPPPFVSDGTALAGLGQPRDLGEWAARVRMFLTDRAARTHCGEALAASVAAHHSGPGWAGYLTALRERLPREHRTYRVRDPKPVPAHFATFWAAFISRVNQHDPLAAVFESAVAQGLWPVPDTALRLEASRASRAFRRNAPPTAFMTLAPPLLWALPRSVRRRLVDHLLVLLRPDGRLRRAAGALLRAPSRGRT
jgi:glycosyltransferase involved in cell wall biosynthesis